MFVLFPFLLMAGFGYECVKDGKLNKSGKPITINSNIVSSSNSSEVRIERSVLSENSILLQKITTNMDSKAGDTTHDFIQDLDDILNDKESEVLRREKRRGGGRGGGGRGRGGKGFGGRGRYSGGPVELYCGANYIALIVVGSIFVLFYIIEVLLIWGDFENYLRYSLIIACVLECVVYFVFMGLMFEISSYEDKDKRQHDGLILVILAPLLYSIRAVVFIVVGIVTRIKL